MLKGEQEELAMLLKSRFPIILVETPEEQRFIALIERVANLNELTLNVWSAVTGLKRHPAVKSTDYEQNTHQLPAALIHIQKTPATGVYVFFDAHPYLDDAKTVRQIRELAMTYRETPRTLIFVSSRLALDADLQRVSASFKMRLPDSDEIRTIFKEEMERWQYENEGGQLTGYKEAYELIIQHLVGMGRDDARRLIRQCLEPDGVIQQSDVNQVLKHKQESLGSSGLLNVQTQTANMSDVGGLTAFKPWLELRRRVFVGEPGTEKLDTPKGVLLLGIQGSGKSLAAKAVAGHWRVPLLRLDFGTLYNKFQGETERNLRQALETAAAMQPAVLWIDEIEKGIASGGSDTDGGVSKRVLGTLLTWMSERTERVFLVATANDISALPPEIMRKGRFDEIFFVDLPTVAVRKDILRIHLNKRGFDNQLARGHFNLDAIAQACEGFCGAEIEQAIISASLSAHAENRALDDTLLIAELKATKPLSVVRREDIEALRYWARERTVPAG